MYSHERGSTSNLIRGGEVLIGLEYVFLRLPYLAICKETKKIYVNAVLHIYIYTIILRHWIRLAAHLAIVSTGATRSVSSVGG